MVRSRSLPEFVVLALISAGFGGGILAYSVFFPDNFDLLPQDEVLLGFLTSVCTFWFAVKLAEPDTYRNAWGLLVDEFGIGTGVNLIVQALLNYFNILTRSIFLIVIGSILAALLLAIVRHFFRSDNQSVQAGIIIVGSDPASFELARLLSTPVVGVVGAMDIVDTGARDTGNRVTGNRNYETWDYCDLKATLDRRAPAQILVTEEGAARIDPALLMAQRLRGVIVSSVPQLYEKLLRRVYCRGREPVDLILSRTLSANARAMSVQAIYTNLIGLVMLILAAPLMAAVALAVALFSGPGPVIEAVQCAGFQKIPFRRLRFRTRKTDGSGAPTLVGKLIARLKLDRLPVLFNIVRGEMALCGPRPVRFEFVGRLTEITPFYPLRFAVKPGMISWGRAVSGESALRRSELIEFEYDLYYVKHGSGLLDFKILTNAIFPDRRPAETPVEFAPAP